MYLLNKPEPYHSVVVLHRYRFPLSPSTIKWRAFENKELCQEPEIKGGVSEKEEELPPLCWYLRGPPASIRTRGSK